VRKFAQSLHDAKACVLDMKPWRHKDWVSPAPIAELHVGSDHTAAVPFRARQPDAHVLAKWS
jgi:hypothetical protein